MREGDTDLEEQLVLGREGTDLEEQLVLGRG